MKGGEGEGELGGGGNRSGDVVGGGLEIMKSGGGMSWV